MIPRMKTGTRGFRRSIVRAVLTVAALLELGSVCNVKNPVPTQPVTILDTPQSNRSFGGDLASVCNGTQFPMDHDVEWQPVLEAPDDPIVAVGFSGTVVEANCAGSDFNFDHPLGSDWETYVALDPQYASLLALPNKFPIQYPNDDGEYITAQNEAATPLKVPIGIMGTELDQGMSQPRYRACSAAAVTDECPANLPEVRDCRSHNAGTPQATADRTVVFGRWIVDCGHKDYHAEIHPPLLSVVGYATNEARSDYTIEGLPFLVSQHFDGKGWKDAAAADFLAANATCSLVVPPGIPCPFTVSWNATLLPPFPSGITTMVFNIRPKKGAPSSTSQMKMRGTIYVRPGVTFEATLRDDGYRIVVTTNSDEYKLPDVSAYDGHATFSLIDLGQACYSSKSPGNQNCELYGLDAGFVTQTIDLHPLSPDDVATYRRFNIGKIWADERTNQPTASDTPNFQVMPATKSIYPIQGAFSVEWVDVGVQRTLGISPSEIDMGAPNEPSTDVFLRATGNQPVTIRGVAITGPQATDFAIVKDTCSGTTLASGIGCIVTIGYHASAIGQRVAKLGIDDNADGAPHFVSLVGPGLITIR